MTDYRLLKPAVVTETFSCHSEDMMSRARMAWLEARVELLEDQVAKARAKRCAVCGVPASVEKWWMDDGEVDE